MPPGGSWSSISGTTEVDLIHQEVSSRKSRKGRPTEKELREVADDN